VDSTVWVAILTGGTAILAGWVASIGNARAARIQAEASAKAQHHARIREARRTAYLEFLEQAHITGELYYRLGDIYIQLTQPDEQSKKLDELRTALRDAYDPLARCARVVLLEGPESVAVKAEDVKQAVTDANGALWHVAQGTPEACSRFDGAHKVFRDRLQSFIKTARATIGAP
jgi:lipopolysaccharide biosynthesis regulator YciM